jgi:GMP synthase (glutamine-hydrolysing)
MSANPTVADPASADSILIVDFGSQVTQLIARRVREAGVYCEIAPFQSAAAAVQKLRPRGIILSGGPASVTSADAPMLAPELLGAGVPVLGICYGQQLLCAALGGRVVQGSHGEFGRAPVQITAPCRLFDGTWAP